MDLLTKQEELFLLAIFRIGEDAYLVNIREHLNRHAGKDWAFGSIYITLEKLRRKGLIETRIGTLNHIMSHDSRVTGQAIGTVKNHAPGSVKAQKPGAKLIGLAPGAIWHAPLFRCIITNQAVL